MQRQILTYCFLELRLLAIPSHIHRQITDGDENGQTQGLWSGAECIFLSLKFLFSVQGRISGRTERQANARRQRPRKSLTQTKQRGITLPLPVKNISRKSWHSSFQCSRSWQRGTAGLSAALHPAAQTVGVFFLVSCSLFLLSIVCPRSTPVHASHRHLTTCMCHLASEQGQITAQKPSPQNP